jgi:hypothetical protein
MVKVTQLVLMEEIVMDTPKDVLLNDIELDAPRVVEIGRVSEDTKGAIHNFTETSGQFPLT